MHSSDFINTNNIFDEKEQLGNNGVTSLSYRVCRKGKQYFMKQLRPELFPNLSNRIIFYKEYAHGKDISSRHIVKYDSIYEDDNELYILMEYVNGSTVSEKIQNDKAFFTKEQNVWKLLLQLLEGLKALHTYGIVYVDINANNIMLTQVGNNVKIIDLGFCFSNEYITTIGSTKNFTAPEIEERDFRNIDERTDIYAVGCLMKYIQERSGTRYSRQYQEIMSRCLKKDKSKRYANTDEMSQVIKRRNRKRNIAMTTIAMMLSGIAFATLLSNAEEGITPETASKEDVDYKVLSHKERTCEVIGGIGREKNIYIHPEISIGDRLYRTVGIADSAFYGRDILSVHIPEGIKNIGHDTFKNCDSIVTISLPSTIENISSSFINMDRLKLIKFSSEMKTINFAAFVDCVSLESIYIPEGVERIELDAFGRCYGLKDVYLPQSLKVIERGVFWECTGLEEITLPASVEEIGDYAFYNCNNLKHIYNHAPVPPAITTIINTPETKIHVPASSVHLYNEHPYWKSYNIVGDL